MHKIISGIYMVQQLLHLISGVESLKGSKVVTASDDDFPYLASLQYRPSGQHFCTGCLITQRHVVTAAHCLDDEAPADVQIVFGAVHLQSATISYTVASWLSYVDWAHGLGIQISPITHDIAIATLNDRVDQLGIYPVRLNDLHKKQLQGRPAILVGWKDSVYGEVLHKAEVKILSDEECLKTMKLITNSLDKTHLRVICTQAMPHVLLECGDSGAPLVDVYHSTLLGISSGVCPDSIYAWGNFSDAFLEKYQMNLHFHADYYRSFIVNATVRL